MEQYIYFTWLKDKFQNNTERKQKLYHPATFLETTQAFVKLIFEDQQYKFIFIARVETKYQKFSSSDFRHIEIEDQDVDNYCLFLGLSPGLAEYYFHIIAPYSCPFPEF